MRLRTPHLSAAAAAILVASLAIELPAAESEEEPKPELTEEIRFRSPNGKYALRIMYDAALNEGMTGQNPPENDGIFSNAMHALAIVSLPGKEIMQDLTESVFQDGNNFAGLTLAPVVERLEMVRLLLSVSADRLHQRLPSRGRQVPARAQALRPERAVQGRRAQ